MIAFIDDGERLFDETCAIEGDGIRFIHFVPRNGMT